MTYVYDRPQHQSAADPKIEKGMWFFILADMSVFALFFGVFLWEMRDNRGELVRDAAHLMLPIGLLNTLVLLASSYAVVLAVNTSRQRRPDQTARYLRLALGGGVLFFLVKLIEYGLEMKSGHGLTSSTFFSYYFVLTGLHMLHVFIGSILLGNWLVDVRKGAGVSPRFSESVAAYWHMVDFLWLLIFAIVYVGGNT